MTEQFLLVSYLLLWTIVLINTYLLLVLMRQVGILNLRIVPAGAKSVSTGPKSGQKAPEFKLPDVRDSTRVLEVPSMGHRDLMLIFVSPGCSSCKQLTPGINVLAVETKSEVSWGIIALGSPSECVEFQQRYVKDYLLFSHGNEGIRDLYEVSTTPYAVLMRPDATVLAAGIVNHIEHLESMLSARRHDEPVRLAVKVERFETDEVSAAQREQQDLSGSLQ